MNLKTSALKNKIGDVLSAPKRAYYGLKKREHDSDYSILRKAREMKHLPKFEAGKGPTEAFRVRSVAEGIKAKYTK